MNNYQFYKKEGNAFIFKNQPTFMTIMVILIFIIAGLSYKYNFPMLGWFLVALAILIIANFFAKKFVIDPQQQTIICKPSVFVSTKTYSFQDFTNFEVLAMKYLGFLTTNVFLNIHFEVNGKDSKFMVGQTLTHKGIQKMVNETEDIMRLNENV
jgi:energy-coupling factor transporter transmembrane protein EcfT